MKHKTFITILSVLLTAVLLLGFTACGGSKTGSGQQNTSTTQETKKEPVTIKFATWSVGTDVYAEFYRQVLDKFRKSELAKEVIVDVEEIPGVDNYGNKMKVLLSTDQLPDIIQVTGANLLDMGVEAGALWDLTPYFENDPEFRSLFSEECIEYNSRNGRIYGIPRGREMIVYFYNKELFKKAGIEPAKTWDEFWDNCEKLKAAGITPLSMQTSEGGWTATLLLCALIGTNGEAGNKFMNTKYVKDFNTPEVIEAVRKIQIALQKYTTEDAVGSDYALAANHFFNQETAMICNGNWMIPDFSDRSKSPEGFENIVDCAQFPESGAIVVPNYGEHIGSKDQEHADAAMKFMKFVRSRENQLMHFDIDGTPPDCPDIEFTDEMKAKQPLLIKFLDHINTAKYKFAEYYAVWYENVIDEHSRLYPELAFGKITPEEYCKRLTEAANKNTN